MRISDWSSDVCSSDLLIEDVTGQSYAAHVTAILRGAGLHDARVDDGEAVIAGRAEPYTRDGGVIRHATPMSSSISSVAAGGVLMSARDVRSEEHTSELQSLMRNSYAVFCLKKKNK